MQLPARGPGDGCDGGCPKRSCSAECGEHGQPAGWPRWRSVTDLGGGGGGRSAVAHQGRPGVDSGHWLQQPPGEPVDPPQEAPRCDPTERTHRAVSYRQRHHPVARRKSANARACRTRRPFSRPEGSLRTTGAPSILYTRLYGVTRTTADSPRTPADTRRHPRTTADSPRTPTDIRGHPRTPTDTCGHPRTPADTRGNPRTPADTRGHPRTPADTRGHPRTPTDTRGHPRTPADTLRTLRGHSADLAGHSRMVGLRPSRDACVHYGIRNSCRRQFREAEGPKAPELCLGLDMLGLRPPREACVHYGIRNSCRRQFREAEGPGALLRVRLLGLRPPRETCVPHMVLRIRPNFIPRSYTPRFFEPKC